MVVSIRFAFALFTGALAAFLLMPASAQQFSAAEIAAMKANYKRPPPRPVENQALVELGRLLFWDPRASASGKTACVSCHLPHLGWAVTDARSRNDSGKLTSRKSPTLIGIGHLPAGVPNGWDGRNATLEAQAKSSIATGLMSMRETDAASEGRGHRSKNSLHPRLRRPVQGGTAQHADQPRLDRYGDCRVRKDV
jgi:cytochrome c peroxidase